MALSIVLVLAGPMVRRVGTDRVSVWVATSATTTVTLSVYAHAVGVAGGETAPLGQAAMPAKQIGAGLFVALPTVTFAEGSRLVPRTIYDYDLSFDGVSLGALGLLAPIQRSEAIGTSRSATHRVCCRRL